MQETAGTSCLIASFTIWWHSETQNKPMGREDRQQLTIELPIEAVEGQIVYDREIG